MEIAELHEHLFALTRQQMNSSNFFVENNFPTQALRYTYLSKKKVSGTFWNTI